MTLAAILAVCFLATAYPSTPAGTSSISSTPQSQASQSQTSGSPQTPPAQPSSTQDSADQPKPAPKPHHRKKGSTSNCSTAAPAPNSPQDPAATAPCPPRKKVVRHGGSEEPAVQL